MRRQIICRFTDSKTFLKHLIAPRGALPRLRFLGDFGVPAGEILRVTLILEHLGERHDLHMRLVDREFLGGARFQYTAEATPEDAVWLTMLSRKCASASWLEAPTSGSCGSAGPFAA